MGWDVTKSQGIADFETACSGHLLTPGGKKRGLLKKYVSGFLIGAIKAINVHDNREAEL